MTDLPAHELDLFLNTVTTAADYARAGCVVEGWRELSYGLERAEGLVADGVPGTADLVQHYAAARDRYAREWGSHLVETS